uniref:Uncharacterized protein n=1 Tax=Timema monikensis TaxID=170555 RepID=A0A7R9HN51_9NEOP|nr:unnamed protein product [Timema monikensis]
MLEAECWRQPDIKYKSSPDYPTREQALLSTKRHTRNTKCLLFTKRHTRNTKCLLFTKRHTRYTKCPSLYQAPHSEHKVPFFLPSVTLGTQSALLSTKRHTWNTKCPSLYQAPHSEHKVPFFDFYQASHSEHKVPFFVPSATLSRLPISAPTRGLPLKFRRTGVAREGEGDSVKSVRPSVSFESSTDARQGASLHCQPRHDDVRCETGFYISQISPCTCRIQEPDTDTTVVACERMASFSQVVQALQNKFPPDADITLKIAYSQLEDLEGHSLQELGLAVTNLKLNHDNLSKVPMQQFFLEQMLEMSPKDLNIYLDTHLHVI